ncbi:Dam family site-specific DNA-(adenine-N6)-methyltransferase [Salmonella enterica]|nr:Dam family site-specific DNA-(adenine-N6)-methyltransferase [Salmonella enterica subsp. enterica serovar Florida]EIQ6928741.1 Dam family site-specific DNA-(adenine-N6)-methyltransferase [Salmonella enterica]ECF4167992.1 Dam family site-specific DNA-(adenine-N6)-methyltransferase [Salmonella enterica subsp. enterica serovar Florida]ECW2476571.1 DNA (cytosine-5-)-methyltransferase [Salmonella enterica subsp. enterica serovar Florida]EJS1433869.1 Dam family site-specific DNA-(adenine-N6)-methyl
MRYGSVCSGIEAASVAWEPLDWQPAWFAEIEAFPSAVLATHWPDVTNLGDMTGIAAAVHAGDVEAPDVLVGGTPCQAFSIAGLRNGLADKRGQLSLSYVELANAIDNKRRERGEEEAIIVWENVPGVLSSKDNAFGCFLAGLAGESCELQPAGGKWPNAGCVYGPQRVIAWRVLDAQFFGVAQRRRRVFVVASARKGFDPAEVLFEFDSMRRDTPPRREPQTAVTTDAGSGIEGGSHWDNPANPHPTLNQSNNIGGIGASNQEIFAQRGAGNHDTSHANSGQPPAICIQHASIGRHNAAGPQGKGYQEDVAFTQDSRASADVVQFGIQVRRLTPIECERLQGFPDNHTLISWRGKDAADCPDGPRYKAIGNSMAVPVMRWIGERIAEALPIQEPTPRRWQRPFLKWAGGKYSLLPELERLIPAGKRLIEPFVGGGSVFLNSDKHERFLLADINADLINLYQMLAVAPDSVIAEAIKAFRHLNDAENYTAIREAFNAWQLNAIERAAAFLYLNRHCFNGLMRYNLDGFFNVGWGKYKAPYFPEKELMAFRKKSSACVFMNAGFERTLRLASDGDVVYCDPPYEPMPGTAGFTNYAAGGFSWNSQVALAESCVAAHQRGAKVFISNSTAPHVIELYERHGFTLHRVNARRSISSKGSTRETANDIVASLGI